MKPRLHLIFPSYTFLSVFFLSAAFAQQRIERLPYLDGKPISVEIENRRTVDMIARGGLTNFFKKIRQGDSVKVAYLGGSITAQSGWRVQSLEWFGQRFPNAMFSEIHAAIGGTGSDFGAFRLKEHVLKYRPDLVFVEFAVNDSRSSDEKIIRSMESIVRQIRTHNPATDICFVYTTIESFLTKEQGGQLPASAIAMERVAERYNIPSVNFGKEIYRLVSRGELIITDSRKEVDGVRVFSPDGVHPYPETGHVIYTTVLKRSLEVLANQKRRKDRTRSLPDPLSIDFYSNPRFVDVDEMNLSRGWKMIDLREDTFFSRFSNLLTTLGKATPGESLSFRFRGTAVGAYDFMGPGTGRIVIQIDGAVMDTISRFDAYCTYTRMNYFILDNLKEQEHQVVITVLSDPFDKTAILARREKVMDDPEKYKEINWFVGKILIDGILCEP